MNLARLAIDQFDRKFLTEAEAKLPGTWAPKMAQIYQAKLRQKGRAAANLAILDTLEAVEGFRFGVASDDDALRDFAKARADECFRVASRYVDKDQALAAMCNVALRYGIAPPAGRNVTQTFQMKRLLCAKWWRRNVRKTAGRNVEGAAIGLGFVSRTAGLYASDEAVKRRAGQRARNREILESVQCINDAGQAYSLQALSDLGTANPALRRMELMTRIAGFDAIAIKRGHAAEFYTLTAPSKYHARHHITGRENPNYNGATPDEAQAYLCKVWSKIRAKLARDGLPIYGFRVAEPHHDATPHWHMLIFCQPGHVQAIRAIFKRYALQVDGAEPGADVHRFKAEAIDRKKGSAVGYIAKYISKNIDGHAVGEDWEAVAGQDSATDTARRVDAWASTWGIRQFQQIGGQSVTVWRELRRAKDLEVSGEVLAGLVAAATAGDWALYTELAGGVMAGRGGVVALEKLGTKPEYMQSVDLESGEIRGGLVGLNSYGEVMADKVIGVSCLGEVLLTHTRDWVFKRGGEAVTPRSSINNCTHFFKVGGKVAEFRENPAKILKEAREKIEFRAMQARKNQNGAFCLVDKGALERYSANFPLSEGLGYE